MNLVLYISEVLMLVCVLLLNLGISAIGGNKKNYMQLTSQDVTMFVMQRYLLSAIDTEGTY